MQKWSSVLTGYWGGGGWGVIVIVDPEFSRLAEYYCTAQTDRWGPERVGRELIIVCVLVGTFS